MTVQHPCEACAGNGYGPNGEHCSACDATGWQRPKIKVPAAPKGERRGEGVALTFSVFQALNVRRCQEAFKHALDGWSLLEWAGALAGEVGEAANVAKKIRRREQGIGGSYAARDPEIPELKQMLADEIGDCFAYLVLLASAAGLDAERCAASKFDRISEKAGWSGPRILAALPRGEKPKPTSEYTAAEYMEEGQPVFIGGDGRIYVDQCWTCGAKRGAPHGKDNTGEPCGTAATRIVGQPDAPAKEPDAGVEEAILAFAGDEPPSDPSYQIWNDKQDALRKAIAREREQAVKDEREACARLADKMADAAKPIMSKGHDVDAAAQLDTADEIARAIRARDSGDDDTKGR